jgi:fumarate reductase flavoprotein subunit
MPINKATGFDDELKELLGKGSYSIFMADSLEELAGKIKVNPDALKRTVDEYNIACETGRDEVFNKKARYLRPIKQPRFYASKQVSAPPQNWEGIRVNYKTEVLTEDYDVIPGLYAAGTDAMCNIYTDIYPIILPGTAFGFCINSGRMAAESALEYIKSK